ncbi:MAG: hypothetical protein II909_03805 [Kiritimatiellae bacterium]|nr:hypothetical protein [Kiritimatiellia bacterium]
MQKIPAAPTTLRKTSIVHWRLVKASGGIDGGFRQIAAAMKTAGRLRKKDF